MISLNYTPLFILAQISSNLAHCCSHGWETCCTRFGSVVYTHADRCVISSVRDRSLIAIEICLPISPYVAVLRTHTCKLEHTLTFREKQHTRTHSQYFPCTYTLWRGSMAAGSQCEPSIQVGGATDSIANDALSLSDPWHVAMFGKLPEIEWSLRIIPRCLADGFLIKWVMVSLVLHSRKSNRIPGNSIAPSNLVSQ